MGFEPNALAESMLHGFGSMDLADLGTDHMSDLLVAGCGKPMAVGDESCKHSLATNRTTPIIYANVGEKV